MGVQNTDSSTIIELNHISVTFREGGRTVEAVKDVTVHVREGEIFGIVGFSGAGKSTLLKMVAGVERPDGGTIDPVYGISIENTEAGEIDYHLDIRAKE